MIYQYLIKHPKKMASHGRKDLDMPSIDSDIFNVALFVNTANKEE